MAGLMSKFLAAIGLGGNKAEADVSYDPALDENATGGETGPTAGLARRDDGEGREVGLITAGIAGQQPVARQGGVGPDVEIGQR